MMMILIEDFLYNKKIKKSIIIIIIFYIFRKDVIREHN